MIAFTFAVYACCIWMDTCSYEFYIQRVYAYCATKIRGHGKKQYFDVMFEFLFSRFVGCVACALRNAFAFSKQSELFLKSKKTVLRVRLRRRWKQYGSDDGGV